MCVRKCVFAWTGSLCMFVGVWQGFLTYILLSKINSKDICVNQLPRWPASLLPLAGWLSRSADLIKTQETISSDFHFSGPLPPTYPRSIPILTILGIILGGVTACFLLVFLQHTKCFAQCVAYKDAKSVAWMKFNSTNWEIQLKMLCILCEGSAFQVFSLSIYQIWPQNSKWSWLI